MMRPGLRVSGAAIGSVTVVLLFAGAASAAPLFADAARCQRAIGKAGEKLKKTQLALWSKCLDGVLTGRGCDTAGRDAKLAAARAKFDAVVNDTCTSATLFANPPAGLGFAAHCRLESGPRPAVETACQALPVNSAGTLAQCLACWNDAEVHELLQVLYPCLSSQVPDGAALDCGTPPAACPTDPKEIACTRAIARRSRALGAARDRAMRKCLDAVNRGSIPGPCPDTKAAKALAAAEAKLDRAIAAACAQPPGWWDACPDDDAAPCDRAIASTADVVSCVADGTSSVSGRLLCQRYPGAAGGGSDCPAAAPVCGDGKVNAAAEQCDPPGHPCADGRLCQSDCTCALSSSPLNSDLAATGNGGGCYPTSLVLSTPLDMLVLVNPEWAPVVTGALVDSFPVRVEGTIVGSHGDNGGDYPGTHVRSDVNTFVHVDPDYAGLVGTGNDVIGGSPELSLEWEAGAYPDWAWGSTGDRIVALGRWIFDCGHPGSVGGHCSVTTNRGCVMDSECRPSICPECQWSETCEGEHFNYSSEIHPPYATAVIRSGRGASLPNAGSSAVPATRTDIFVSTDGGAAGDGCMLTHLDVASSLLNVECYPLADPVAATHLNAQDFSFDVPLPAKPAGGTVAWRIEDRGAPGGVPASVDVESHADDPSPYLHVSVRMSQTTPGGLPTGFAGTLYAGWENDPTALTHVRVTLTGVVIHNALQPVTPVVPRRCSVATSTACAVDGDCPAGQTCLGVGTVKRWRLQAGVNGEWQELPGLDSVNTGDVIPQNVVFDQHLPAGAEVHLEADGASEDCIHTLMGKSLKQNLAEIGFNSGINCLLSTPHDPGRINKHYAGPGFGVSPTEYQTRSSGGDGGTCSVTTSQVCVTAADCPAGQSCSGPGRAFSLRYLIESVP